MMSLLNRYIAKSVLASTALVLFVVSGLIFFINFIGELRDIGVGDYGLFQAFSHVALGLPHSIYEFFPMVALLGGVFGLGMLASNQELMVMRASGVSVSKLIAAVLCAACILIVVVSLFGELVAPHANYLAESRKTSAQNKGQAIKTKSGAWVHQGNNFLHIKRVVRHNHLIGVTRYQFDNHHHLLAAYYADSIEFIKGRWVLHNLVKTTFSGEQTSSQHFPETTWDFSLNAHLVNVGLIAPAELSLDKISEYTKHLTENGLRADNFKIEFWNRIFKPLTALVMVLLAIPFVLAAPRSATMGWRMLFGIIIGFVFYISNAFFSQFSLVFQISPIIAAVLPTLLFAMIGGIFIIRMKYT